jgi:hypothetical protein
MHQVVFAGSRPDDTRLCAITVLVATGIGPMTTKEKAISVINSLDDSATLDEMIDRLYLLRKIELGIAQADAEDVVEHEEFMAELEQELEQEDVK